MNENFLRTSPQDDIIRWIAPLLISDGGPDVILPEKLLDSWTGYAGPDYEIACEVGGNAIAGRMPESQAWILGKTAGTACVGSSGGAVIILRIITAPERFRLPDRRSEIPVGEAGPEAVLGEDADALIMSAASMGDSVYESDAVNIHYSSNSVLSSSRIATTAGGNYLLYIISNASAVGTDLREWLKRRTQPFEDENGSF